MSRGAVVVTGLGAIGAYGLGVEALDAALAAGGSPTAVVDRSAGYHRPGGARLGRLAAGVDLTALVPAAQARRMGPPGRFAVAAARLALRQAGLDDPAPHLRTAVVAGTAFGPSTVTEQLLGQILRLGPDQASPALFTESVASAAAAQVAMLWKARGPALAVTQREASDLVALGEGARLVASGRAERALVVVVDEMIPLLHAVLDRFRALARADAAGVEAARPFDRRRSGAIGAEGAAALLLEPAEAAAARGAAPLVRIAAWGSAFDPSAPSHDWGTGAEGLARGLARLLERRGLGVGAIDRIVSGASGSRRGDRLEAATLGAAWAGGALPPIHVPKGALGEYGGGFLAAALRIAAGHPHGPAAGFREPDPELGVAPHRGPELPPPARTLVSALASSGAAAWAVLEPHPR